MRINCARFRSRNGFTLPEMLVVISVIVILTALALPAQVMRTGLQVLARDIGETARRLVASVAQSAQAAGVWIS